MKKLQDEGIREGTRVTDDGRTVSVVLRIDRRDYEYARSWARFHGLADPNGTAEEQLEGRLSTALAGDRQDEGWQCPPEIAALYPKPKPVGSDMDDDIPF